MSIERDQFKWECVVNHLPQWTEDLSEALSAVMSNEDHKRIIGLLDRYNELTDIEESQSADGHSIYGIEDEKKDIIDLIIKIEEKWKDEAIEFKKRLNL